MDLTAEQLARFLSTNNATEIGRQRARTEPPGRDEPPVGSRMVMVRWHRIVDATPDAEGDLWVGVRTHGTLR